MVLPASYALYDLFRGRRNHQLRSTWVPVLKIEGRASNKDDERETGGQRTGGGGTTSIQSDRSGTDFVLPQRVAK